MWTFGLESDDGSRLWIGDQLVVDNDGLHGAEQQRSSIALEAGFHSIDVRWFNASGGAVLGLKRGFQAQPLAPIPSEALRHRP